jgi:hypothetical protein
MLFKQAAARLRRRAISLCLIAPVISLYAQDQAHSKGWVVIPVSEYGKLHDRAFPSEAEQQPSPLPATLTRVDYDLRVDGGLAAGRASLTLDLLQDGWAAVPVPAGLHIREALLDGKPATLVPMPGRGGEMQVLLSKRGRSVLALDVALPVSVTSGEEVLAVPATGSGVTQASITMARQDVNISVSGGVLTENTNSGSESRWVAYAHGNDPLTFTWRRKIEDRHIALALRLRGSLVQMAGLGEDSTSIYAEANIEVTQGEARQVRIQVPDQVTINQVQGATVGDWGSRPASCWSPFWSRLNPAPASSSPAKPACPRRVLSRYRCCACSTRSAIAEALPWKSSEPVRSKT